MCVDINCDEEVPFASKNDCHLGLFSIFLLSWQTATKSDKLVFESDSDSSELIDSRRESSSIKISSRALRGTLANCESLWGCSRWWYISAMAKVTLLLFEPLKSVS